MNPLVGLVCTTHPDRPARGLRGQTMLCRACLEAAVPGLKLTPDGWRYGRDGRLEPDADQDGQLGLL